MTRAPVEASAPGKVILLGEHAVVHGRPAIAVPVAELRATARLRSAPTGSGFTIVAADLGTRTRLNQARPDDSLARAARLALTYLDASEPDVVCTIRSSIPIAGGLGSGAAVSAALVRGLARYLGHSLSPAEISSLVFEVEKLHHGTPSGVDNTVVAYEQPVFFQHKRAIERLAVGASLALVIADTGTPSATVEAVSLVRRAWERQPDHYNSLFDGVAELVLEARAAIESGQVTKLGRLMDQNQTLLAEMGVSSDELERLVESAHLAGALGAKLSGAGRGGNVVALVEEGRSGAVSDAMVTAGAVRVFTTTVA